MDRLPPGQGLFLIAENVKSLCLIMHQATLTYEYVGMVV
jgi:hypothetical protein